MAGSLMLVAREQLEKPVATVRDSWQVHFSRFFTYPYPSLPSTCPPLIPLPHNRRYRPTRGSWISTSSHTASLRIINDRSNPDAILSVCFRGKILEEHYITKLHFSWPQVSCVAGYPARGSKAVFVSYRDSVGEIQKFALRFSTLQEVETFINDLKEILEDATEIEPLNSDFRSEISSQSEFMSTNLPHSRAHGEALSFMTPVHNYTPQIPPSLNYEVGQQSCTQKTTLNHNFQGISPALPPSFMSLLTNCSSEVNEAAGQQTVSEEVQLKSQIVRYMEDHTFQDMLIKVEKVISEMGDDLSL